MKVRFNHDLLRRKREELRMSKQEVADHLGVTYQSVWNWENGHVFPTFDKLIPYCALLGIDPKELAEVESEAA
jgi:transcriptional regulator with XRE-family HTH domain